MNTPRTKASPTPNGKATAIPAMETAAESKMLEALKIDVYKRQIFYGTTKEHIKCVHGKTGIDVNIGK